MRKLLEKLGKTFFKVFGNVNNKEMVGRQQEDNTVSKKKFIWKQA